MIKIFGTFLGIIDLALLFAIYYLLPTFRFRKSRKRRIGGEEMKKHLNYPKPPVSIGQMLYPSQMGLKWWNEIYFGVVTSIHKKEKSWKSIDWFKCVDCARLYSKLLKEKHFLKGEVNEHG